MRRTNLILLMTLTLFSFCSDKTIKPILQSENEGLVIYYLPQYASYLIDVSCEDVKTKDDVKMINYKEKNDIQEFISIFLNKANFESISYSQDIDARISIYCNHANKNFKFCISRTGIVDINGQKYRYKDEIKEYLARQKIIYRIVK